MPYKENNQLFSFEVTIHIGDEFARVTVFTRMMTFLHLGFNYKAPRGTVTVEASQGIARTISFGILQNYVNLEKNKTTTWQIHQPTNKKSWWQLVANNEPLFGKRVGLGGDVSWAAIPGPLGEPKWNPDWFMTVSKKFVVCYTVIHKLVVKNTSNQ